jgi:formylglycine-generating enzyme required for sulfatase activity
MIKIPAGKAVLGTSQKQIEQLAQKYNFHPSWLAAEKPRREVSMKAFYIDEYPVTNFDYLVFCNQTKRDWAYSAQVMTSPETIGKLPVCSLNINDVNRYAKWAGKRLPTEAEWEYAARGPQGLIYPWGNHWDPARCNTNHKNIPNGRGLKTVDAYPKGISPFGIKDTVGNLGEWVSTKYSDQCHVVKGAFWQQHEPYRFRAACRMLSQQSGNRVHYIGFRCARDG